MACLDRDSNNVKAYENGSFRDRPLGKGIYHAMPMIALKRTAQRYEYGQTKYGKSGAYKEGLPVSDSWNSAMRHLIEYMDGDNSEDHLAAVVWNCFCMMEMEVNKPEWQDIPARMKYKGRCKAYLGYTKGEFK